MRRKISDKTYTVGLPSGAGPAVIPIPLSLPDCGEIEVTAWIGNFGSSNVYIMRDPVPLVEAQTRVAGDVAGLIDCLMAITAAGPVGTAMGDPCRSLTVFFETTNSAGQTETVTVRVRVYE